jgi:hypothetical protein
MIHLIKSANALQSDIVRAMEHASLIPRLHAVKDKVNNIFFFFNIFKDGILDSRCLSECPSNSFSDINFGVSPANKRTKSVFTKTDKKTVIL